MSTPGTSTRETFQTGKLRRRYGEEYRLKYLPLSNVYDTTTLRVRLLINFYASMFGGVRLEDVFESWSLHFPFLSPSVVLACDLTSPDLMMLLFVTL